MPKICKEAYVVKAGKKPFDWNHYLRLKVYRGDSVHKAMNRAHNWVTCACGNQCSIIPRDSMGAPYDDRLYNLGCRFADQIELMYRHALFEKDEFHIARHRAIQILAAIERRSDQIIASILRKQKKKK